jgi:hypothetical protein
LTSRKEVNFDVIPHYPDSHIGDLSYWRWGARGSARETGKCAGAQNCCRENVPGLKIVAGYGAYTEHTLYYVVEADDYDTVEKFLLPGFKLCKATITPVSRFFGE